MTQYSTNTTMWLGVIASIMVLFGDGRLYKKGEADAFFVEAPQSKRGLATIARGANMLEEGVPPLLDKPELQPLGCQLAVCPLTALYASAKAMQEMFDVIKTRGTTRQAMDRLLPFEDFHKIMQIPESYALDGRYRTADPSE